MRAVPPVPIAPFGDVYLSHCGLDIFGWNLLSVLVDKRCYVITGDIKVIPTFVVFRATYPDLEVVIYPAVPGTDLELAPDNKTHRC